ncbi:MAG TPA: YcnI family protein [Actinomycetota bacterium]|nr:YcnI family protein [Actinomycetota bacterium]
MTSKKILAGAVMLTALLTGTAHAHVTVQPEEAPAGAFFRFVVRVPNEKDNASTTKVGVEFPENLIFTSFQPKPGWQREVEMKTLDEPIEAFGAQIDEVVGSVTWSGGTIKPHEFEEFGFSVRVPEEPGTLEFKAYQTYSDGEVVEWTKAADADNPAAHVDVVALPAEEGQGQLSVLADVKQQLESMSREAPEVSDDAGTALLLGGVGTALGAIALLVALLRPRKA